MCDVGVQSMHQRRSLQDDSYPRVAMTVDAALVTLRNAKPTLQIQIVRERGERGFAHKQARRKAHHHLSHLLVDRRLGALKAILQGLELLLPLRTTCAFRFEGRRHRRNVLHIAAQRFLFGFDGVEAAVDAAGQAVELRFGEAPFFSSKLRWIESRTSLKASAMRKPGGCSGPP